MKRSNFPGTISFFFAGFKLIILPVILFYSCSAQNQKVEKQNYISLKPASFAQSLNEKPGTLLDVRTPGEFSKGHLQNAVLINLFDDDFNERLYKTDRSKPVYVYCAVGGRSAEAAEILIANGYTEVFNLDGGIVAWQKAGFPVE